MKFTTEPEGIKYPTLNDVAHNQFFVDWDNYICQKETSTSYFTLADDNGKPACFHITNRKESDSIKKILPKVLKIEI